MESWKALIVEGDLDSATVIEHILSYHNVDNITARSAEMALVMLKQDLMKQEPPAIIIVDLALPGMDGWELLKALRGDPATANIPAVAVTAFHTAHIAAAAVKAGFEAYFAKPIRASSFVAELENIVGAGGK